MSYLGTLAWIALLTAILTTATELLFPEVPPGAMLVVTVPAFVYVRHIEPRRTTSAPHENVS